ncbi:DUF4058 family protein [Scytonema hofmannii FACHB-248]|uniref:DUF4058 family protein n=1 Tax=Scytonema hofmannii FACHB-248 TaxID=1842502 RepID=A0ABR8GSW9_9CYAN|nr:MULTISPECIES: DUF4058 family protein [Nostocales]MBD2606140.1 DUF4058 family protein [Scytonema hofmannii FACHB-248]
MNSPFPGMNPYLENPVFWSEVHHRLIAIIADEIEPNIPPQYRVAIEQRTYLSDEEDSQKVGIPDVTIFSQQSNQKEHSSKTTQVSTTDGVTVTIPMPENVTESYLEIREIDTGFVVTTIEILSPKNKRAGEGRKAYERKRKQVLASLTHLVEIDLLRNGRQMSLLGEVPTTDYRIVVSPSEIRPQAKLYGFSIREKIPAFVLPLQSGDKEVILDLQPLLNRIYARARYYLTIDYNQEPIPPLKAEDKAWADTIICGIGN